MAEMPKNFHTIVDTVTKAMIYVCRKTLEGQIKINEITQEDAVRLAVMTVSKAQQDILSNYLLYATIENHNFDIEKFLTDYLKEIRTDILCEYRLKKSSFKMEKPKTNFSGLTLVPDSYCE